MCYDGMKTLAEKLSGLVTNQSELSRKTGIAQSAISAMTTGTRRPYGDQVFLIARALGVSADYLLDDALDKMPEGVGGLKPEERSVLTVFRSLHISEEEGIDRLLAPLRPRNAIPSPSRSRRRKGS